MADRYWVGGTGTWSGGNTANWSATSGGGGGASVPTAADNVFFNANSNVGTNPFTVTMANTPRVCNDFTASGLDGAMTLAGTGIGLTVSGSLTFQATNFTPTYTGATTFAATTTGKTVTTNGVSFPLNTNVGFDGVGGAWQLQGALTCTFAFVVRGSLDLNNFTLTCSTFNSNFLNTRSIAFGTGNITCTSFGTVWDTSTVTGLTTTGTQVANVTYAGLNSVTVSPGAMSEANSISFNFTGGNYTLTFLTSGHTARNVNFTGSSLNLQTTPGIIYGNLTLSTGMVTAGSVNILTFGATSGTKTITTNGRLINFSVTFNGVGGTWQLQDAMTVGATRTTTLTNGTLDLGNFTLSTGIFSSDNSNTRSIAFGTTGSIVPTTTTAATTVLAMATATNFTFTGTSNISAAMSVTRTFNFGGTAGATTSNRLNVNTISGSSVPTFTGSFRQINFTGSTSSIGIVTVSCHGFTLASGGTYSSATFTIVGDGTLTHTGRATGNLTINGAGITTTLADAGQTQITTLTNGTLNLAGFTLTNTTRLLTAAGTKNLTFNGGTLVCSGSGTTAFNNASFTNFTTTAGTGTGLISMTSASTKTFVGGGSTFNCTLNQGGAGALTITGSNTFNNITNTVQPATVLFTAGTTNTFLSGFSLSGTSGNLITIGSATAASHTLSKASGTVSVSFCSISRSSATGGAAWQSFFSNGNVNNGNNTGWDFTSNAVAGTISESAIATESISVASSVFNAPVSEISIVVDSILAAPIFNTQASEAAVFTDSALVAASTFNAPVSETFAVTDSTSVAASTFSAPVQEAVVLIDSVSPPGSIYNPPIVESLVASDLILGAYLWNLIDDSQSPSWQNITNPQTPGWTDIDDSQTPGWTDIN